MYGLTCGVEVEEGRLHVKHFYCQMETGGQNECTLLISAALSWPIFKNICAHTHSTLTYSTQHTHTAHTHSTHTQTHTHIYSTHIQHTHIAHTHIAHTHRHTHTQTHIQHTHTHSTLTHSLYQTALGRACPRSSRCLEFLDSAGEKDDELSHPFSLTIHCALTFIVKVIRDIRTLI